MREVAGLTINSIIDGPAGAVRRRYKLDGYGLGFVELLQHARDPTHQKRLIVIKSLSTTCAVVRTNYGLQNWQPIIFSCCFLSNRDGHTLFGGFLCPQQRLLDFLHLPHRVRPPVR